ncbi:MAG TPA: hypothetical protein DCG89_08345 [Spartobacteria bacterium]|nr:hypothetical protein [Spartobacteria bacterium]
MRQRVRFEKDFAPCDAGVSFGIGVGFLGWVLWLFRLRLPGLLASIIATIATITTVIGTKLT